MGLLLPDSLTESVAKGTACLPEKGLIVNVVAGIAYCLKCFTTPSHLRRKPSFLCGMFQKMKMLPSGRRKFMLLGADINLTGTVGPAGSRFRKLTLRGQCGMVRFHL